MTDDNAALLQRLAELERKLALERHHHHVAELNAKVMKAQWDAARGEAKTWEEIAHTDALTGTGNLLKGQKTIVQTAERRHLLTPAEKACEKFEILFIDLDKFGKINKLHGDSTGDTALQALAKALRNCLRETDFLFRKGGDEFIIGLVGARAEDIERVIDKIAKALESEISITAPDGSRVDIRGSFGRVEWDDTLDVAENLARADELMRASKRERKFQREGFGPMQLLNYDYAALQKTPPPNPQDAGWQFSVPTP